MGYWKREYTEGKTGKPLFKPEPVPPPADAASGEHGPPFLCLA
jgi:hypothetical protein